MFRAILELLLTIFAIIVARAILTSLTRGISGAAAGGFRGAAPNSGTNDSNSRRAESKANNGGDLHRDPVCGTFVAESTPFQRKQSGRTFYYCSDACREKHSLVA
jgi:hypothetical protein